jgi:hypothetical protein
MISMFEPSVFGYGKEFLIRRLPYVLSAFSGDSVKGGGVNTSTMYASAARQPLSKKERAIRNSKNHMAAKARRKNRR